MMLADYVEKYWNEKEGLNIIARKDSKRWRLHIPCYNRQDVWAYSDKPSKVAERRLLFRNNLEVANRYFDTWILSIRKVIKGGGL